MTENQRCRLIGAFKTYLLLTPFLFCLGNSGAPFELIKLLALVTFSFLVASILVIQWLTSRQILIRWNSALTILAALVAANFISYCFSINHYLSFWGDDQLPSDSLLSILALFAFCFSVVQAGPTKNDIYDFLKIICFTGSLLALHALLQSFGFEFATFQELTALNGKLIATIGQPVILSTVLVSTIPIFAFLFRIEKNSIARIALFFGFVLVEAALLRSDSRTPWLLNIPLFLTCLFICRRELRGQYRFLALLGACSFIAALFIWQSRPLTQSDLFDKFTAPAIQKAAQSRFYVWKDGLASFSDHWLVGSGPETFGIEQKKNQSYALNLNEYWKTYWAKAHNQVVQFAVTTGLVGLLVFFSLYYYLAANLFWANRYGSGRAYDDGLRFFLALAILTIFLCNLTSFNFIITQTYTSFLFVLFVASDQNSPVRSWQAPVTKIYRFACWFVVLLQLGFIGVTATYWYSDLLLQKSYLQISSEQQSVAALDLADQALFLHNSNPFTHCHKANALLNVLLKSRAGMDAIQISGLIHDVAEESQTCVDLAPNRYQSHLSRGRAFAVLFQQGYVPDSTVAEASFLEFHKLAPFHPGPYFEMALLDLRNQKPDEFIEKMQSVLKLKPDFIPAYTVLIKHYSNLKNDAQIDALVAKILTVEFKSGEFVPEIKSVAALCHDNGKQILADQLENFYLKNKYLILKTY